MPLKINDPPYASGCFIGEHPHPGSLTVTECCLAAALLAPGSTILDLGCGTAQTIMYLIARGYRGLGFDHRWEVLHRASEAGLPLVQGDWMSLPLKKNCLDAVFAECTFSLIQNLEFLLEEIYRCLRTGGKLLFNGLYVRNAFAAREGIDCSLKAVQSQTELQTAVKQAGFELIFWQDHSEVLRNMSVDNQLLTWQDSTFAAPIPQTAHGKGLEAFDRFLAVANLKIGYYAAVAQKAEE